MAQVQHKIMMSKRDKQDESKDEDSPTSYGAKSSVDARMRKSTTDG